MISDPNVLDIQQVTLKAAPIFNKYKIQKAILFGSMARGRQSRKSDVDLLLIQQTEKSYFERFEGLLKDLYQVIQGRDIEVFIYTPEELKAINHRKFIERALREGKVIYES
jgi:predicted nucleotidyltransferase